MEGCRLAVDIGGTFTDVVLETPKGFFSGKVLTTPAAPEEGVVRAIALVLEKAAVAPHQVSLTIHGTTLGTNAIIERRGARTALITTQGFKDTLEFAFGHRFDQYDLEMVRPTPLVARPLRLEAPERIAADGSVLLPLDEGAVRALTRTLREQHIQSVAVSLIHAYREPRHELRIGAMVRELRDTTASIYFVPDVFAFELVQGRAPDGRMEGGIQVWTVFPLSAAQTFSSP